MSLEAGDDEYWNVIVKRGVFWRLSSASTEDFHPPVTSDDLQPLGNSCQADCVRPGVHVIARNGNELHAILEGGGQWWALLGAGSYTIE